MPLATGLTQAMANLLYTRRDAKPSVFNALDRYYGLNTGVGNATADTDAVANAVDAMMNNGRGVLYLPGVDWHLNELPSFEPPAAYGPMPYAIRGDGRQITKIYPHIGSIADSLTVSNPAFDVTTGSAAGVPEWGGFTIDGTYATGDAAGLNWGDVGGVTFRDMEIVGFESGDGMLFSANYGWLEKITMVGVALGDNLNCIRFQVNKGKLLGTGGTTLNSGSTYTSVPLQTGITRGLYSGETFIIYSGSGTAVQTLTTSAQVAAGDTTIPVVSFVAAATYTAGTAKVYAGAYGSFDYWKVLSLNLDIQANQNGIVSEIPQGIKGNLIERVGGTWNITGNAHDIASNGGKFLWLKGNDPWTQIVWDVAVEHDGVGTGHVAIQIDDATNSGVAGSGRFCLYGGFAAASLKSRSQFRVSGDAVNVNGITQAYPGNFNSVQTHDVGMTWKNFAEPTLAAYRTAGATAPVSGSGGIYQNLLAADVEATFRVTGGASGSTVFIAQREFGSGMGAGSQGYYVPAGADTTITFTHMGQQYVRIDAAGATLGAFTNVMYA